MPAKSKLRHYYISFAQDKNGKVQFARLQIQTTVNLQCVVNGGIELGIIEEKIKKAHNADDITILNFIELK